MKFLFKLLSFIGLLVTSVIFGFVYLGEVNIPSEIHLLESEQLNIPEFYDCNICGENAEGAQSAFSVIESQDGAKRYTLNFTLLQTIPVKTSSVTVSKRQFVVPGGEVFGIKLYTNGVIVVGMDDVKCDASRSRNPAKEAGLKIGDVITALDGRTVNKVGEVTEYFQHAQNSIVRLSVYRTGKPFETEINLVRSESDSIYKAGLWIRDSTAGVGTVTYYDKNSGVFAGLGHAVCDVDTGTVMPMIYGEAVAANINGCYRGSNGVTGELCGVFTTKTIGKLYKNGDNGIYGQLDEKVIGQEIPVAARQEIKTGPAQIISTVDSDGPAYYDIRIVKLSSHDGKGDKNMVIEVTDPELIAKTGGIVQGMSGSPIIQNGMLVGAVTHVFVNNPKQGYAILAQNMLETSQALEQELIADKAS